MPGWESFDMDYLSSLAPANTAPIIKSGIPLLEPTSINSMGSYRSYDSGVGLEEHHVTVRLVRPPCSYGDENADPTPVAEL